MIGERRLLVDHGDATLHHLVRIGGADLVAVDGDLALVAGVRTGEDLHQRRLAGAVLTDESKDLAGENVDVDIVEGVHPRKRLPDASHDEHGCRQYRCVNRGPLRRTRTGPASMDFVARIGRLARPTGAPQEMGGSKGGKVSFPPLSAAQNPLPTQSAALVSSIWFVSRTHSGSIS